MAGCFNYGHIYFLSKFISRASRRRRSLVAFICAYVRRLVRGVRGDSVTTIECSTLYIVLRLYVFTFIYNCVLCLTVL